MSDTTFIMGAGSGTITARSRHQARARNIILEELGGWDDGPEEFRAVYAKMDGAGDFVSEHVRLGGKTLDVVLTIKDTNGKVRDLRADLMALKASGDTFRVQLWRDEGEDRVVEYYNDAFFTPGSPILWAQSSDIFARVSISLRVATPFRFRSVNNGTATLTL